PHWADANHAVDPDASLALVRAQRDTSRKQVLKVQGSVCKVRSMEGAVRPPCTRHLVPCTYQAKHPGDAGCPKHNAGKNDPGVSSGTLSPCRGSGWGAGEAPA